MGPTKLARSFRVGTLTLILLALPLLMAACGTNTVSNAGSAPDSTTVQGTTASPKTIGATDDTAVPETTGIEKDADEKGIFVEKEAVSNKRTQERALKGCAEADLPPTEDTSWYARDYGVSEEVADRRMDLMDCLPKDLLSIERELKRKQGDSFAGFWLEHEPKYQFVFLFTEEGLEKIQPYIQDEPYAPLLEVRSGAEVPLKELKVERRRADRIVDRLDIRADSAIDVERNRGEIFVTDRRETRTRLREAGVQWPEHVAVIEVEELSRPAASN